MCVVSMVMDHYWEKWGQPSPLQPYLPVTMPVIPGMPTNPIPQMPRIPTQEEIAEFYKLLKRAREYDAANNQPDCELEEKKQRLMKLAEELGIKIKFDE